jgi:fumarate hydratase class I
MDSFRDSMLQLITQTSTNLPPDVRRAMASAMGEEQGGRSLQALNVIATNIDMACDNEGPICQDTGWPTFEIKTPVGANQLVMKKEIREAIAEATKRGKLRTNSVDSLTGVNASDNLGPGTPTMHFDQWENADEIEVKLLLKGGGCENKNIQYSLPMEIPNLGKAGRDLDGVRKCLLHAVWQAQGQGCSAGAIGVCIGGDRAQGYLNAKEQLFRTLDDTNPIPELAKLEDYIVQTSNTLGIGTMGFGGGVTLIGCKIGVLNRLPASFFVSVAYDCWAFRRLGVVLDAKTGAIKRWLYRDDKQPAITMSKGASGSGFVLTGKEKVLRTPLTEEQGPHAGSRRCRARLRRDVHRARCRPRASDEARPAGRFERFGALSLRPSRAEERQLQDHRRRPDDQHPRRALSRRDHQTLRRARRSSAKAEWARKHWLR